MIRTISFSFLTYILHQILCKGKFSPYRISVTTYYFRKNASVMLAFSIGFKPLISAYITRVFHVLALYL